MSSGGDPPQDHSSRRGERRDPRERRTSGSEGSRPQRSNLIEFVDSQDPNVRSAIQRHTAYHSAAQRREARSRLLRRSSSSRYFEWARRPGTDPDVATSSASSASSVSMSPAPSMSERPGLRRGSSHGQESESTTSRSESASASESTPVRPSASAAEDSILHFCMFPSRPPVSSIGVQYANASPDQLSQPFVHTTR